MRLIHKVIRFVLTKFSRWTEENPDRAFSQAQPEEDLSHSVNALTTPSEIDPSQMLQTHCLPATPGCSALETLQPILLSSPFDLSPENMVLWDSLMFDGPLHGCSMSLGCSEQLVDGMACSIHDMDP